MTILYCVWIFYTVGSLSAILLVLSIGLYSKWETKKRMKKFHERMKADSPKESTDDW